MKRRAEGPAITGGTNVAAPRHRAAIVTLNTDDPEHMEQLRTQLRSEGFVPIRLMSYADQTERDRDLLAHTLRNVQAELIASGAA